MVVQLGCLLSLFLDSTSVIIWAFSIQVGFTVCHRTMYSFRLPITFILFSVRCFPQDQIFKFIVLWHIYFSNYPLEICLCDIHFRKVFYCFSISFNRRQKSNFLAQVFFAPTTLQSYLSSFGFVMYV